MCSPRYHAIRVVGNEDIFRLERVMRTFSCIVSCRMGLRFWADAPQLLNAVLQHVPPTGRSSSSRTSRQIGVCPKRRITVHPAIADRAGSGRIVAAASRNVPEARFRARPPISSRSEAEVLWDLPELRERTGRPVNDIHIREGLNGRGPSGKQPSQINREGPGRPPTDAPFAAPGFWDMVQ
jgi:hypothetical protein